MRRAILLMTVVGIVLVVVSGVALAASQTGTEAADTLTGGASTDRLAGGGDHDTISGKAGNDELYGDQVSDTLDGGPGNDLLDGGGHYPGGGGDRLIGGKDSDFINAADDFGSDLVEAGEGGATDDDTCIVDVGDRVFDSASSSFVQITALAQGNGPVGDCENVTVVGQ